MYTRFVTLLCVILFSSILSAQTSSDEVFFSEDTLYFYDNDDAQTYWIINSSDSTPYKIDTISYESDLGYNLLFEKDSLSRRFDVLFVFPGYREEWEDSINYLFPHDSIKVTIEYIYPCIICKSNNAMEWFLESLNFKFSYADSGTTGFYKTILLTGDVMVSVEENTLLADFQLFQNYPNPFNPSTTIEFNVKELSLIHIDLFDILGRKVGTLFNKEFPAGRHSVAVDISNYKLSSGIYFIQMTALKNGVNIFSGSRKVVYLK